MMSTFMYSSLRSQPCSLCSLSSIQCMPTHSYSRYESKSVMKAWRDGSGGGCEEVLSFQKALVYCWRACIYFMPPQIVGKGRAGSVGVIREVERERARERERESERESALPQRAASLTHSLSPVSPLRPCNTLSLTHTHPLSF